MTERFWTVISRFLLISGVALLGIMTLTAVLFLDHFYAALTAYLLSFLFVASNLFALRDMKMESHRTFYKRFLTVLGLRFFLVLAAIVLILKTIKFDQIYFTVSFIISYIFHSVIEIIFINKLLETDN